MSKVASSAEVWYLIMDGRAHDDVDRAIVLESCFTLDQAMSSIDDWPEDSCIVRDDTWDILYSPMWNTKP